MVQLAGNLSAATDTELATLLQSAIRTGDNTVKAIVFELHGRYCGIL